ncbi:MAG: molybdopterin biosynthesis protein MoeB [Campylobacterales bacterium]|nr:molybdopterin biosynthesis protein MoeB [Campylobacterales bacterium]
MFTQENEILLFQYGKDNYQKAIDAACETFELDKDEDELVTATTQNSCYNCLFRRWTRESFMCMKKSANEI